MTNPTTERTALLEVTEYLAIDLSNRQWKCRCCGHGLGDAEQNYKFSCLVADRDPREVHPAVIEGPYTFAPDPDWCRIVEFYCPGCITLIEVEYLPPGHPVTHDIEIDIDALKSKSA